MDFGLALTYQFKDPDWPKKLLLAVLISLIPVIGWFFVFGWSLEVTRRVIQNETQALPEIDLARDLGRGLEGFVISLVYNLPVLIITVPLSIILAFTSAAFNNNTQLFAGIWVLSVLCAFPLVIIYSIASTMVIASAYGAFLAQNESFAAGFNLGQVIRQVRKAPAAYFLVLIGQIMCGFIAFFGIAACVVGVVFTMTYSLTVMGHLYGQAYKEAVN